MLRSTHPLTAMSSPFNAIAIPPNPSSTVAPIALESHRANSQAGRAMISIRERNWPRQPKR